MKQSVTGRNSVQINLRLADGIRDRLRERALGNMRSVTAEINFILSKELSSAAKEKATA